jgi:D-alanyl-D-alanine carboxypeptidase/D-alanyl-D-alanine-endopeptidase (penicillin-binding protein 4)
MAWCCVSASPEKSTAVSLPADSVLWTMVTPKDKKTIALIFDTLKTRKTLMQRISRCSEFFIDKRYDRLGPTGEGVFDTCDTKPLYCLKSFDCVTYIEHVLALSLGKDTNAFMRNLQRLRYADGKIDYLHRNHFFILDWLWNNRDLFETVSPPKGRAVQRTISKKAFFAAKGLSVDFQDTVLSVLAWTPREIEKVSQNRMLNQGAYIFIFMLRVKSNLDANHVGFMIVEKDTTHFRCASKLFGKVAEMDFAAYVHEFGSMLEGVVVQRIQDKNVF